MEPKVVLNKDMVIQDMEKLTRIPDHLKNFSLLRYGSKVITISPVMKEILQLTHSPHSIEEIIKQVAENNDCKEDRLSSSIHAFLDRMIALGVLVYEGHKYKTELNIYSKTNLNPLLDQFNLLNLLGKNSKTAIYKCTRKGNRRKFYVIKVFRNRKSGDPFRRELDILNFLPRHENIRKGIEADVSNGVPYLLLDYIEGTPLPKTIEKLPLNTKYQIISQLIATIDHLHRNKVLHGDIHASNFLIDAANNVHLIDLGMAYYEHDKEVRHGGIPRYMPPERIPDHNMIFSNKKGDYVSEVFQLAVCIYLLLTGKPPFEGTLLKDLAFAIKHRHPLPPDKTNVGEPIPRPVAAVLLKALEKDPVKRFQSTSEMLRSWRLAVDGI